MFRAALLAPLAAAAAAFGANPTPPCSAPPGVVPILNESLCFDVLAPTDASGVTVRLYGFPANASFVSSPASGAYLAAVPASITGVLNFYSGQNDEQRNILSSRTVPFAITPPKAGVSGTWVAYNQVSPAQFPDDFKIPRPNPGPTKVSLVSSNINMMASFQFNTTGMPYLEDFQEACGVIQNSTLPSGYAVNTTSAFSPTYVFYNGMSDANFTCECWMAVMQV
jgi:hypothetical protein